MTADEKITTIVNGGENFYENFRNEIDQRFEKCFEWLGFGVTSKGTLAIEANISDSPFRFQFLLSLKSSVDAMCRINIRVRSDGFDGARSQADEDEYFRLMNLPQVFGPNANIRDPQGDPYFKPFGYVLPQGVLQHDISFDARTPNANPQAVLACAAANSGEVFTLIEAIHGVLSLLRVCGCTTTIKIARPEHPAVVAKVESDSIDFPEFGKQALLKGYKAIQQADRAELLYIRTKNGVKTEINTKQGTCIAGYGLTSEQLALLAKYLFDPSNGNTFKRVHLSRKLIYIQYEGMPSYWKFVSAIENFDLKGDSFIEFAAPVPAEKIESKISAPAAIQAQMIDFAEFARQAKSRKYKPKQQSDRPELLFIKTRNQVKVEVNTNSRSYIAGYGLKEEEMAALKACLLEAQEQGAIKLKFVKRTLAYAEYEGMEKFWWLVNLIENISAIVARSSGFANRPFKEVANKDIFVKIAKTYKFAIEIEHQNLLDTVRVLLEADKMDEKIWKGCSKSHREEDSYREHVVPCVMIHNEVIRIFLEEGGSDQVIDKVAKLIESNLVIIKITDEERELLDETLGLRTKMPNGWQFGDDIYARLIEGGIEIDLLDENEEDAGEAPTAH